MSILTFSEKKKKKKNVKKHAEDSHDAVAFFSLKNSKKIRL